MRPALLILAVLAAAGPARAASPAAVAANEAGGGLFRAGTLAEAIAKFEEALALDPGFDPARRNLATALATRGQEELRRGISTTPAPIWSAPSILPPTWPRFTCCWACFICAAGTSTRRAGGSIAPWNSPRNSPRPAKFPATSTTRRARWNGRAPSGRQALAGGASAGHALRAKLDRVGRELSAEGGFGRDVSRHFTIQYDGPVPREVARTALLLLEKAYDRLWRDFGRSPQHDVPVILYTRGLFDEITRSPGWVGGTYDGKIRVPVGGPPDARATPGGSRRSWPTN